MQTTSIEQEPLGATKVARTAPSSGTEGRVADGWVLTATAKGLEVAVGGEPRAAKRAASCLLAPRVGDRVLIAELGGEAFVLSVLERAQKGAPASIEVEGDLDIVSGGRVAVRGRTAVELIGEEVGIAARRVDVVAEALGTALSTLSVVADHASAKLGALKSVAKLLDHTAERITVRAKNSVKLVEELDQVRAGQIDIAAERTAQLRAEHASIQAGGLVRVDGTQVHIG